MKKYWLLFIMLLGSIANADDAKPADDKKAEAKKDDAKKEEAKPSDAKKEEAKPDEKKAENETKNAKKAIENLNEEIRADRTAVDALNKVYGDRIKDLEKERKHKE